MFAPFSRSDHAVVMWKPNSASAPYVINKKRIYNFSSVKKYSFEKEQSSVNWNLLENFEC